MALNQLEPEGSMRHHPDHTVMVLIYIMGESKFAGKSKPTVGISAWYKSALVIKDSVRSGPE